MNEFIKYLKDERAKMATSFDSLLIAYDQATARVEELTREREIEKEKQIEINANALSCAMADAELEIEARFKAQQNEELLNALRKNASLVEENARLTERLKADQRDTILDFLRWLNTNSENSIDHGWIDEFLKRSITPDK